MRSPKSSAEQAQSVLIAIRREAWHYEGKKPGRVPPADSPNRPALARLWHAAYERATARRKARTFTYADHKFCIVYIGSALCVMDWEARRILVKPPASMSDLASILNPHPR